MRTPPPPDLHHDASTARECGQRYGLEVKKTAPSADANGATHGATQVSWLDVTYTRTRDAS